MSVFCKSCGNELSETVKFCNKCGTPNEIVKPVVEKIFCGMCGGEIPEGDTSCKACAKKAKKVEIVGGNATDANSPTSIPKVNTMIIDDNPAPSYTSPEYISPAQDEAIPGKNPSKLIPIILIVLIIAVVVFDCLVLFTDLIFKKEAATDANAKAFITVEQLIDID